MREPPLETPSPWAIDPKKISRLQSSLDAVARSVGMPAESEIEQIIANASPAVQEVVRGAFYGLMSAKRGSPEDKTPWRELLAAHQQGIEGTHEDTFIDEHGRACTLRAFIDGDIAGKVVLQNLGIPRPVIDAVVRLQGALNLLNKPGEAFISRAVINAEQSRRARRSRNRQPGETGAGRWSTPEARNREIGDWLASRGYATSSDKETLVDQAMRHFDVSETAVRDAARAAGLARSYRKRAGGR